MDILDQIDQALREVDEDGWFTDAMHWVPGSSSDTQEAEEFGGGDSPLEAVLARLMDSYTAHLDEGVLVPSSRFSREQVARLFDVPPELLPIPPLPSLPVSSLPPLPLLSSAVPNEPGLYRWQLDLQRLLAPPPPMTPEEEAALVELGRRITAAVSEASRALVQALRPTFDMIGQVARELGPVVMPRSEPPPDHPLERVRRLRAQRGSGPPVRQRAPRRIDPRGTR